MKKVAIMQPYILPYIGYFQLINAVDKFVIYDDVQFIKRGWINRNNILFQGEKKLLTIPLNGASSNKQINEIEIFDNNKFLKTLETAYVKAPYKRTVMPLINEIFSNTDKNLSRFIGNSLKKVSSYIGIETIFCYSSDIEGHQSLKGQNKIIHICKAINAGTYINPIGGKELYDRHIFKHEGINLYFINPHLSNYRQLGNEFIPGLSIVDVLMFNSKDKIQKMLNEYVLE